MCLSLRSIRLTLSFSHQLPPLVSPLVSTCPLLDMISLASLDSQQRKISAMGCSLPSRPERRRCSPRSQPNSPSFSTSRSFGFFGRAFTKERRKVMSLPRFFGAAQQNGENRSFQVWLSWTRPSTTHLTRQNGKNITNKYIQKRIFPIPGGAQGQVGWGRGQPGLVPHEMWKLAAQPQAQGLKLDDS